MTDLSPASARTGLAARVLQASRQPVDAAALALFRMGLGLLVMVDAVRKGHKLFNSNDGKPFRFSYEGFEWVPSAGEWGPVLGMVWFGCGALVMIGLFYRPAIIAVTALAAFGFLQAEEYYLNHYYLLIIVCFLMCLVPANRAFAVDRWLAVRWRGEQAGEPVVARLHMWLLKGQTEIVLIYAGLVKLNADWLRHEPLRSWLIERQDTVWFGFLWNYEWVIATSNYGVIALHVLGAPLLLWQRTRLPVFVIYCLFHISNHFTFDIGIFPWMTIAMSTLFFPTDWPRRLFAMLPLTGAPRQLTLATPWPARTAALLCGFSAIWLFRQAVIPLRHFTYPGDVAWTYEGHRFSWRMKLNDRWSPGFLFAAYLPERHQVLFPPMNKLLTERQFRKATTRPRMAKQIGPQLARKLEKLYRTKDVRVHVYMPVGYNNREPALLIDPKVDLARASDKGSPPPWINIKYDKPLRRIEQFDPNHKYPSVSEMAKLMGLPPVYRCQSTEDHWLVCPVAAGKKISSAK